MENVLNITRVLWRTSRSVMTCPCPILPSRQIREIMPLNIWNPGWFIVKFLFSRATIIFVAISTPNSTERDACFWHPQPHQTTRGFEGPRCHMVVQCCFQTCSLLQTGSTMPVCVVGVSGRSPGMSLSGNVMAWELYASLGVTFRFIFVLFQIKVFSSLKKQTSKIHSIGRVIAWLMRLCVVYMNTPSGSGFSYSVPPASKTRNFYHSFQLAARLCNSIVAER